MVAMEKGKYVKPLNCCFGTNFIVYHDCFPSESDSESTSESSDGESSPWPENANIGTFDNNVSISKRRIRQQQWRNSKRRFVGCPSSFLN